MWRPGGWPPPSLRMEGGSSPHLTLVGEEGKFYTVLKVVDPQPVMSNLQQESGNSCGDTFTCGQCGLQMFSLAKFLAHKQSCQQHHQPHQQQVNQIVVPPPSSSLTEQPEAPIQIILINEGVDVVESPGSSQVHDPGGQEDGDSKQQLDQQHPEQAAGSCVQGAAQPSGDKGFVQVQSTGEMHSSSSGTQCTAAVHEAQGTAVHLEEKGATHGEMDVDNSGQTEGDPPRSFSNNSVADADSTVISRLKEEKGGDGSGRRTTQAAAGVHFIIGGESASSVELAEGLGGEDNIGLLQQDALGGGSDISLIHSGTRDNSVGLVHSGTRNDSVGLVHSGTRDDRVGLVHSGPGVDAIDSEDESQVAIIHNEPMLQALSEDSMDTTAVKDQLLSLSKVSQDVRTAVTAGASSNISDHITLSQDNRTSSGSESNSLHKDAHKDKKADNCKKEVKDKKAVCTYCGKGFKRSNDLAQHIRCHTGEKPFQCVVCGRGFAQKSNVKKHMVTHKVMPVLAGSQDRDVVTTTYQCSCCQESFDEYLTYKSHLKVHDSEKVYRCVVTGCGECFQTVEEYVDHTTSHQNMEYKCHACPDRFTDLNDLNLHQFTHLTDRDTRVQQVFECGRCKNKYSSQTALDCHLETAPHSFSCTTCAKNFSTLRMLRKHVKANHSDTGQHACEECGKSMKTEHALKRHRLVHSKETPFACEECGARFNRKDKLTRHSQSHNRRKKFKCPFQEHMNCDKQFHRLDKLKQHITTHGNIKFFSCTQCDAKYSRKEHLKTHMAKKHNATL